MRLVISLAVLSLAMACKQREAEQVAPPADRELVQPTPVPPATRACEPGAPTCVGDDVVLCNADGSLGATREACKGGCREGTCVDTCALQDVELIYLVDDQATLYAFDPKKLPADPFRRIATLACDPRSTVNSMAVDRSGVAWLGYHNGKVHRASIIDGRCAAPGTRPRGAPTTFGMGFVTTGPRATTEQLFVAGGPIDGVPKALATLDTATTPPTWTTAAPLAGAVRHLELTGTGDGRLFGYFPTPGRGFVQELDRASAQLLGTPWTLEGERGEVSAYAFAHWGGVFYVFSTLAGNSAVHAIHMKSGTQELVQQQLPRPIVGAGVSTCAPLLERAP
ncbi:MAG: hypothetical protein M3680_25205 [Myxococcota bacterium]|nr:hypothetical protein [Myxococcota bacterium]